MFVRLGSRLSHKLVQASVVMFSLCLAIPAWPAATAAGRDGGGTYYNELASSPFPAIDGTISSGEWSAANSTSITLNGFSSPGNTITATWYFMNDGSSLYIALQFTVATSFLVLDIDDGEDHSSKDGGEDYMRVDAGYSDRYWSQAAGDWLADTGAGGTTDGSGKRSADTKVYETSKPLDSGDFRDFSAVLGSTIGFRIETYSGNDYYRFPQDTVDHDLNFNGNLGDEMLPWMDLVLADAPNAAPELKDGKVSPSAGNTSTSFTYSVTYTDSDDNAPTCASVVIDGKVFPMFTGDHTYTDGSGFTHSTKLSGGSHTFAFNFSDGRVSVRLPASGTFSGPEVEPPAPPTLSDGTVEPGSGTPDTLFRYSVRYNDSNGDAPIVRKVYIDGVSSDMTATGSDYRNGTDFSFETKLSAGAHSYRFMFSDLTGSVLLPESGACDGPAVAVPNQAPVYNETAASVQMSEDAVIYFDLDFLFYDPDGDMLEFTYLGGASDNLTVEVAPNGSAVLRPARDYFTAQEILRFNAEDPSGANCSGELVVRVRNVNDPPYIFPGGMVPDPQEDISINEGDALTFRVSAADIDNKSADLRYTWFIDDTEKTRVGTHTYTWRLSYDDAGAHTVMVRISDNLASIDAVWNVTVNNTNRAPIITSAWPQNNTEAKYGTSLAFSANATDPDGDNMTFYWRLSDGTLLKTETGKTSSAFAKTLEAGKLHIVVLEVQDGKGGATRQHIYITVTAQPVPVAILDAPASAVSGKTVSFSGWRSSVSEGSIERWSWDFGDGTGGDGVHVTHVYKKSGRQYTVTLTVADSAGQVATASFNITVKSPPPEAKGFIPGFGGALLAAAALTGIMLGRRKRKALGARREAHGARGIAQMARFKVLPKRPLFTVDERM